MSDDHEELMIGPSIIILQAKLEGDIKHTAPQSRAGETNKMAAAPIAAQEYFLIEIFHQILLSVLSLTLVVPGPAFGLFDKDR